MRRTCTSVGPDAGSEGPYCGAVWGCVASARVQFRRGHAAGAGGDLLRSRAELLAENALLRQQLLVLRAASSARAAPRPTARSWCSWPAASAPGGQRPAHRAARDAAALASRRASARVWRRKIAAAAAARRPQVAAGDDRADPGDGGGESAVGRGAHPGRAAEARTSAWPSGPIQTLPARAPARRAARARPGRPSCATTPTRSGPATSSRSPTCSSGRCTPSSSIALGSRRVVHVGVTRHPTDAWVAQQLREATPFDQRPRYLIRDNDSKYGPAFARVAAASGITELRTAYPRARGRTPTCERFLGQRAARVPRPRPGPGRGATCGASSASTSRTSTGTGRTRALGRRRRSHRPTGCATWQHQCAPCRYRAASTMPFSAPRRSSGRIGSHHRSPGTAAPPATQAFRRACSAAAPTIGTASSSGSDAG